MIRVFLSRTRDPEVARQFGYHLLRGLAVVNLALIREAGLPPIYESGVRYVKDPEGNDTFADALHTFQAGRGDCSSLVAWRVGELWAQGELAADFYLRHREYPDGHRLYHILIRRGDGSYEDPSRLLGM